MENLLDVRDLYDVERNLNSLLMPDAFFLGALKRIEGEHPGIAAGADLIGDVHDSSPLDEATFAIALLIRLLKCVDTVSDNSCTKHHDNLQYDIDHFSTPIC